MKYHLFCVVLYAVITNYAQRKTAAVPGEHNKRAVVVSFASKFRADTYNCPLVEENTERSTELRM